MRAHGRVDSLNPENSEVSLPILPVSRRVLIRLVDSLLGGPEGVFSASIVPFGRIYHLLVPGMGDFSAFYSCHVDSPYRLYGMNDLTIFWSGALKTEVPLAFLMNLFDRLIMPWRLPA